MHAIRPAAPPGAARAETSPPADLRLSRRGFFAAVAAAAAAWAGSSPLARAAGRARRAPAAAPDLEKDRANLRHTLSALRGVAIRPEVEPAFPFGTPQPPDWKG
ncbi:MAG TPA: hypothetical protein VMS93_03775 [Candidatus Saccharimonadales bacterium]|nr:hypothetical protein [Candidatus Saccharimonadales bacterium]